MEKLYFTWWNLENLFDVEDSPRRPAWLQSRLASELRGWSSEVLTQKIENLSKVIAQMNEGKGPDLLGVCEVENKEVMNILAAELRRKLNRRYLVRHHSGNDGRGIDIAFLVDSQKFSIERKIFTYEVLKRSATRDILQINLQTKRGNDIIVIGNHWPARSGGQYQTEPYRMMCGETLSYWISRIIEIRGENIPILVMGDFNDEPFNRSLTDYCMSSASQTKVRNGRIPYLYNLTQQLNINEDSSYVFGNERLLIDQMMVSKGFLNTHENFDMSHARHHVFSLPNMTTGIHRAPIRFGRPSSPSSFNTLGFSDHLPLILELEEKLK
ncbi:endonuclease/exonuclease/phosphatase family protein [Mongoliitalea daihaiensis]|uniref:endonuclease/exonuclease/phosphatase family protein n=1 Tax=Mongoliitalea daihaiensis TaxID=2782006 RepID=UPI001F1A80A0|nr:endonuclease/exonuclease/phosphatase family protein [Mongoliitalea daihaiensis]UJP65407.1 endonuclease/exonuclease/phosphatase family protein [Mongoliitalea daihaiensis]